METPGLKVDIKKCDLLNQRTEFLKKPLCSKQSNHAAILPQVLVQLCTLDLPAHVLDADFFVCLFVIVVPISLCQINSIEFRVGFDAGSFPFALSCVSREKKGLDSGQLHLA